MAVRPQRAQVRKGRPCEPAARASEPPTPGSRTQRSLAYWRNPIANLAAHVACTGKPVVLELFSGSGKLAAEWRRSHVTRHIPVFEFDLKWGKAFD
eukprot:11335717-Heterocapsa_arctica.AAC.1